MENDEGAVTITESMWPPLRVKDDEDHPNDQSCAHVVFSLLLLIFAAASVYTFWKAYTTQNWSSSITKEVFKFPVVTICPPEAELEKTIEVGEYNQCHVWDTRLGNPDKDYDGTPCDVKIADDGVADIEYMGGASPCVVYNPNRSLDTREDGSLSLNIQFDALLSGSQSWLEGVGTRDYPVNNALIPDYFTLFVSDTDVSKDSSGFWTYIQIPTSGMIFFNVNVVKQDSTEDSTVDVYTIENFVHFPWKEDDVFQQELTSSFTEIWMSSSEAGVSHIKLVPVSITVILGSLWGLFGLVFTVFYVCFSKDVKQPRFLVRRIRGLKECTKSDAQVVAGAGHAAAEIVPGAKGAITNVVTDLAREASGSGGKF